MVRCLRYLNSMSDIVYKKYKILVNTIMFNIIVFQSAEMKKAGAALVITVLVFNMYFGEIAFSWRVQRKIVTRHQ